MLLGSYSSLLVGTTVLLLPLLLATDAKLNVVLTSLSGLLK